jgi:TRAP-type C4-dicarboxylate transport system permease large subunit
MSGFLYQTLEGIFGTAVDVSSSLIILFTIYGAFLQHSGAGKFYLDWSFAAMGSKHSGAGRTVVLASFLLGGPSGSGVATTVTIGSVAYPMLERAGYGKEAAGGLLAAGGLGAIISPPVLGAAAFLIAEFLKISYLDVLLMATVPDAALLPVALPHGRARHAASSACRTWRSRSRASCGCSRSATGITSCRSSRSSRSWCWAFSPMLSVFWATVVTFAASLLRRDTAMGWRKVIAALRDGSGQMLNVAATCAAAGIIVGVVAKTGLGLKFSAIVIAYAGGSLFLTALFTALIVWVIGLAVPVTASYIICAVIAAPALTKLGVPDFAAHMFIFYYAVLSEVSPPTALSPFAAAAITAATRTRRRCSRGSTRCPRSSSRSCSSWIPPASAFCSRCRRMVRGSSVAWIASHGVRRHRSAGGGNAKVAARRMQPNRALGARRLRTAARLSGGGGGRDRSRRGRRGGGASGAEEAARERLSAYRSAVLRMHFGSLSHLSSQ